MAIEYDIEKIKREVVSTGSEKRKGLDITDIIAEVKDASMSLPKMKIQRQELIKKIAEYFQNKQGHFYFDEVYDILETVYGDEVLGNEGQIIQEIDEWVSDAKNAELLEEEEGSYCYRIA